MPEAVYKSGTGTRGRGHRDACVGTWDVGTATVLVKLVLVMPAINALSERSYSALKKIKNYLRSTMTQKRTNN